MSNQTKNQGTQTSASGDDSFLVSDQAAQDRKAASVPRLFVREPGWSAFVKQGSERLHCFAIAPGESVYHRIADGEIYLKRGDERICIPCADRLGLLHHKPKALKAASTPIECGAQAEEAVYGLEELLGQS